MKKIILTCLLFVMANACLADIILEVPASPDKGFNFPYLIKLPEVIAETDNIRLIVESNNTGKVSDEFSAHYEAAKNAIVGNAIGPLLSKKLSFPILMPVFPRSETQWDVYTHALDRDTIVQKSTKLERIDLQLLAMIEDAKNVIGKRSIHVQDKIILAGFSASGTFANRFSLLHPEKIEIVIAGGLNGTLMFPIEAIDNRTLDYPIGIGDFYCVTGKEFDLEQWLKVKQFLFMGEKDTNDAVSYDDAYSEKERLLIYETTGKKIQPDRWLNSQKIYLKNNATVNFRTFKGIGHGTNGDIHREILSFVHENI